MAANVFGTPITDETLKGMPKYHDKKITRLDRASVAFEMKNAEGKDVNARQFVENLRKNYGWDCIMCVLYNATGGTVKMDGYLHGDGSLAPSPYPVVLQNGQWGAYLHNIRDSSQYKDGAHILAYSGKNGDEVESQWMYILAALEPGRCYTEIRSAGYYLLSGKKIGDYSVKFNDLKTFMHQAHDRGCSSFASIGGTTKSPVFEGIMTLQCAWGW